jgi:hypothetical protein
MINWNRYTAYKAKVINSFSELQKCAVALLCCTPLAFAGEPLRIGAFSEGDLRLWEPHSFHQQTDYRLTPDAPNLLVLKATSTASASGLIKKQRIDLSKTPFINWRWKINNYLTTVQERSKAGDDYAARLYVVLEGGLLFWQTKSINYVWASNIPKQTVWPNAYAGDAVKMIALRDKTDPLNTWVTEKRNVRDDFKRYLGLDVQFIDAVALMTDTDDSHESATAFYGDITFTQN